MGTFCFGRYADDVYFSPELSPEGRLRCSILCSFAGDLSGTRLVAKPLTMAIAQGSSAVGRRSARLPVVQSKSVAGVASDGSDAQLRRHMATALISFAILKLDEAGPEHRRRRITP